MRRIRKLTTWLFTPLEPPATPWKIIEWWEKQRLFYNLYIGVIGTISLLAFFYFIIHCNVLGPGEDAEEPLAIPAARSA